MKQIITIKLHMPDERSRSKAMRVATQADGRIACVKIGGQERDRLVTIGENIDSVKLTRLLRKKFPEASIESVKPVIDGQDYDDNYNDQYGDRYFNMPAPSYQYWRSIIPNHEHYPSFPQRHDSRFNYEAVPVYDPNPPSCNIM